MAGGAHTWDESVFELAPKLRTISHSGASVDSVKLEKAKEYDISAEFEFEFRSESSQSACFARSKILACQFLRTQGRVGTFHGGSGIWTEAKWVY